MDKIKKVEKSRQRMRILLSKWLKTKPTKEELKSEVRRINTVISKEKSYKQGFGAAMFYLKSADSSDIEWAKKQRAFSDGIIKNLEKEKSQINKAINKVV